jgi:serine phosphatase RsbU (regulator of sigma subunit)/pSer/pThr/pTyr-binding forkhead associated (FHA) protein
MACLQVLKGLNPGQVFPLDKELFVLGRHPDCDIVLDVGAVSRQHARIVRESGEFYVEDLHSRNGTIVNGQLINSRHQLRENDRVKICDLLFTFHRGKPGEISALDRPTLASSSIELVVDEDDDSSGSTIMSKLDLSHSDSGFRMTVRPEAKLRALVEISQNLGKTLSLEAVLPKLLDSLFKIFIQADRGLIVLRESEGGPLLLKAVKHRRPGAEESVRVSRTIVNQAMNSKEAILSADAASDARFDMSQSIADFRIRSLMCAPLIDSEDRALGVIQIDSLDQRSRFRQDDLEVLASVARQAAIVIENANLHEAALHQQRIARDLELAHQVQRGILPSGPPSIAGYEFYDFYESAAQLGGDYYDYIELPGRRLAVVVADVAGKGIPAALLMARFSADVRYCLAAEPDPARAVSRLNAVIASSGWQDRFVTCAVAVLDLATHEVALVNAGHLPPLVRHGDRQVEQFGEAQAGIPLGIAADYEYQKAQLVLAPGEMIALYTDGLSEAMNGQGELFGIHRLRSQFGSSAESLPAVGRQLLDGVRQFVGQHPQSDDICLVAFGRRN